MIGSECGSTLSQMVKRVDRVPDGEVHPEVIKGNMTEDEVLMQFLARFEQHSEQKDGIVTWKEFLNYYKHVGADIPNDEYFILMVSQAWRI